MKVFVAGHKGMVGSAVVRALEERGDVDVITRSRHELDLLDQDRVAKFLRQQKLDSIILAAAKVGGIQANNDYPAEFIFQNLQIQNNVINGAFLAEIDKLLFLGSSCIYPKNATQPMSEDALMTGVLEPTNEPYAVAKIAGIKMCESYNRQYGVDYRSVMPTNLYGPGDNYDLENSHVVPGLIRKLHEAKVSRESEVLVWGSGSPRREFLHVDDMASACLFIADLPSDVYKKATSERQSHINVGSGVELSIRELAEKIQAVTGFQGELVFDTNRPDGVLRKFLNSQALTGLGWRARINFEDGLKRVYEEFCK